ncbi:MAG: glycosyltransferase [Candidatus Omnitrophica bacterium]|nr:glycosyltransferase [Candidatus Omnitrophota bacterium]MBI2496271.1 glycosyltransferase [Candidatus Omnitrophota bacterium]MBI3022040.1 glycosyltransferase [Candidatus Omnitrophota bacterium]MBI3082897.1 glycosyltransferase [Candidatus Omnitrophota bacterium]
MRTGRRFVLMHITTSSGHHRASCAIEHTLKGLDPRAQIVSVDAFQYTSRFVRWAISRSYLSIIRHQPDVWEYLYDNPSVHRRVQYLRVLLHRYQAGKLQRLLETVRPEAIACTQAYPCGMVADFKKHHNLSVPLVGVLTDYAPHLYWFHETVDAYVVPSEQVKQRFVTRGVDPSRIKVLGIPIDRKFLEANDREAAAREFGLDPAHPIILIMGGGSGFGQIRDIVLSLDILPYPCHLVVVAGTNRSLRAWLQGQRFRHRVVSLGYTDDIPKLMDIATLLVSKPGGLTTSEALAKQVPLVIVNPIPGQEAYNARFLLSHGAAVQAGSPETVRQTVRDLLDNPGRLAGLRRRNAELAHPNAAADIARLLIELADGHAE